MFSRIFVGKGLWHNPNFLRLWLGSTISLFGSQVTFLALPFTAALILHANSVQMGILSAANTIPFLLVGLFAGVWVDRMRRRPLLIVADIGHTMLLGSIPLVAYLGILHIAYLYGVAFLVGILTLFFDIAYGAFLPSLVERDELIEGNSKLQASIAVAEFVGPSLAGVLIQWLTAPLSLVVDALSFLASALSLLSLRVQETSQETRKERQHFWYELRAGIGNTLYNITSQTLVQTTTPDTLLGRVRSSQNVIGFGSLPVGALLGGVLANMLGIRQVLLGACLLRFALLALFLTPLWRRDEIKS